MIYELKPVNYDKPFKTNEILERGQDEVSLTIEKINELIGAINALNERMDTANSKIATLWNDFGAHVAAQKDTE